MKKYWITMLALFMALCFSTAALAQDAPAATPSVEAIEDVEEWLFDEDAWLLEEDEEVDPYLFEELDEDGLAVSDSLDEVEDILMGAMEVYSWFVLYPLDVDYDKPNAAGDKYQVLDDRFNTMEKLRGFVQMYFSDEITEALFDMGVYAEENGYLYAGDEGRQIDENIGETEFEVVEETPTRVEYRVTVNYWGGETPEKEVFTYVQEELDGEWKFTEFPFYW